MVRSILHYKCFLHSVFIRILYLFAAARARAESARAPISLERTMRPTLLPVPLLLLLLLLEVATGGTAGAAAGVLARPTAPIDPATTAENERYLEPYLSGLAEYRDSPIGRLLVAIADLVDVVPTWLEDLLVPLVLPDSNLTIPLDLTIPLQLPAGHGGRGVDELPSQ